MIEAVILSQGDELLTGQTVDTNSAWLADRLWALGVPVRRGMSAPDRMNDLVDILRLAAGLAPVVVCTGGLGPTRDDLTAEAVGLAFDRPLALDAEALAQVHARYATWGRKPNEAAEKQALLPKGAIVLENRWGTAPGFRVDVGGTSLYFMPGVPREMKPMFQEIIEPDLRARFPIRAPGLRIIRTTGVPEGELEGLLRDLDAPGLTLGYRTMFGENQVKLRFEPEVPEPTRVALLDEAVRRLGRCVFGVDSGDLAAVIGERLVARGETLALAESCTAGRVAAWIASIPGASRYLMEGAVVYSNEAKVRTAGVRPETLAAHGAVSEETARELAEGIRARAATTWGVAITGVAGPGGGSPDKPVGTVHIAVTGPTGTTHRKLKLSGDRDRVTSWSAALALKLLFDQLG